MSIFIQLNEPWDSRRERKVSRNFITSKQYSSNESMPYMCCMARPINSMVLCVHVRVVGLVADYFKGVTIYMHILSVFNEWGRAHSQWKRIDCKKNHGSTFGRIEWNEMKIVRRKWDPVSLFRFWCECTALDCRVTRVEHSTIGPS